ncbi:MAG: hypothetical protein AABY26_04885, partial [Nanoarchaeota archaeon]
MRNLLQIEDEAYFTELKSRKTFPLHLHWDGSIPVEELFSLAQKRRKKLLLPEKDVHNKRIFYASEKEKEINSQKELRQFQHGLLHKYKITDVFNVPISFMQTKEDLNETARALCRYLQKQNSPYAEVRFAPQYHL